MISLSSKREVAFPFSNDNCLTFSAGSLVIICDSSTLGFLIEKGMFTCFKRASLLGEDEARMSRLVISSSSLFFTISCYYLGSYIRLNNIEPLNLSSLRMIKKFSHNVNKPCYNRRKISIFYIGYVNGP